MKGSRKLILELTHDSLFVTLHSACHYGGFIHVLSGRKHFRLHSHTPNIFLVLRSDCASTRKVKVSEESQMVSFIMLFQICLKHVTKSTYNTQVLDHLYLSISTLLLPGCVATHCLIGVVLLLLIQVARPTTHSGQVAGKPVLQQQLGSGSFSLSLSPSGQERKFSS